MIIITSTQFPFPYSSHSHKQQIDSFRKGKVKMPWHSMPREIEERGRDSVFCLGLRLGLGGIYLLRAIPEITQSLSWFGRVILCAFPRQLLLPLTNSARVHKVWLRVGAPAPSNPTTPPPATPSARPHSDMLIQPVLLLLLLWNSIMASVDLELCHNYSWLCRLTDSTEQQQQHIRYYCCLCGYLRRTPTYDTRATMVRSPTTAIEIIAKIVII